MSFALCQCPQVLVMVEKDKSLGGLGSVTEWSFGKGKEKKKIPKDN